MFMPMHPVGVFYENKSKLYYTIQNKDIIIIIIINLNISIYIIHYIYCRCILIRLNLFYFIIYL